MASTLHHKKTLHSMLAIKLNNLTIPSSSADHDFDFVDVFGLTSSSSTNHNPNPNVFTGDPPNHPQSVPLLHCSGEDGDVIEVKTLQEDEQKGKIDYRIGPGDFEIMRVIGKGSFGSNGLSGTGRRGLANSARD
ncbi:hypothetical protein L1987_03706 [Smallanthus sonchifolius]|uniref:Uncharacterized protein n=1 Tax=Smallanthus sonchifolius TaxID=185202 RepID=A0ACB9KBM6_9ASTR|nr:hypothetical protein L1987_03706 [Smallanthus sonchifolius]